LALRLARTRVVCSLAAFEILAQDRTGAWRQELITVEGLAVAVLVFQLSLLLCFVFFSFFNYLYGFAALKRPRVNSVPHSGRRIAVVIVSYNEKHVFPATIESCDALTYPDRLIVLSDDSDDGQIVSTLRQLAISRGCRKTEMQTGAEEEHVGGNGTSGPSAEIWESPQFVYFHRKTNSGFKGGNLREVSRYLRSRGIDLMYLLDADWHPQPDALERSLEALEADARAAFVQTRRITLPKDLGLFQRYVTLSEEGCYYVDFEGRQALGHPILFSGCCTLLRLDAVEEVGGFAFGHLTEDLDVTNRLWLAGWKGIYLGDVTNYGEVPYTYNDFRRQQERWSSGTARCLKEYFWQILRCKHFDWIERLSAIRQNAYFSTSLLTAIAIAQGVVTVLWLTLGVGSYPVEYYLYVVTEWRLPLVAAIYACVFSNFVEPLVMILAKKRRRSTSSTSPWGSGTPGVSCWHMFKEISTVFWESGRNGSVLPSLSVAA
jgi:cellulose synthase/poly-beta-1,6-N-acetylglucosamine synthase-like glycosyltransferase